jgi:hypothetical protein
VFTVLEATDSSSFNYNDFNEFIGEMMTDTSKYKSVAVRLPIWNKLQSIAGEDFRSVGKVIEYLVDKEDKVREKKKKNGSGK